ncbi:MAG: phosphatase PAP2 family protein [Campylobacterales bacterium]|nr:phosphatase PAP2 family protein [Campylobacterales bacterium]
MIYGLRYIELLIFFILALFFFFFYEIDIYVASLFFKEGSFYLKDSLFASFMYNYVEKITLTVGILILIGLGIAYFKEKLFGFYKKDFLFIVTSILVGPLLIVNLILKEFIGRPRPRHLEIFGGDGQFHRAFDITANYCSSNCSFVCGHCSAGFIFIVFAFLFTGTKRKIVFSVAFLYGVLASLGRIIQGGHFLSDAVFSFIFIYMSVKVVHYLFYGEEIKN